MKIFEKYLSLLRLEPIRFLIVGGFNTIIGCSITILLYYLLEEYVNIVIIGFISNLLAITISFTTQKVFVFRTKGNWLKEYFNSYFIYGGAAILNVCGIWLFVEVIKLSIWISTFIMAIVCSIVSYLGLSKITFKR